MSIIKQIQILVQNGLYYLTEHAEYEANIDGFNIYDIEAALMSGKVRRTWPKENKYEVIGHSFDNKIIGVICRITQSNKVRIITVYKDAPKK